jgi:tRNA-modifying protein YgfZ
MLAHLPDRGMLAVSGEDRVAFLQGLVSNDVDLPEGGICWAALLTPQGKWLADFFVVAEAGRLLLECERAQAAMIAQRLARFRLRSRVAIEDVSGAFAVHAAWGTPPGLPGHPDPRLPDAGWRIHAAAPVPADASTEDYARHRIALGLPDGSADLEAEKSVLLEAGFDELHGVSWSKGCYMGQELTARTKYRGLVKKRLVPVEIDGEVPPRGTPVLADGAEVGELRSAVPGLGLALLRLDSLDRALACGAARLAPRIPGWMRLPERAA